MTSVAMAPYEQLFKYVFRSRTGNRERTLAHEIPSASLSGPGLFFACCTFSSANGSRQRISARDRS